mmetsp:Transcript_9268/g.27939  ORF Transcript_9268/g.27939 Transcript_9268/m.27939 type:complete len:454 (-) Transcript_9268:651-2012(-)
MTPTLFALLWSPTVALLALAMAPHPSTTTPSPAATAAAVSETAAERREDRGHSRRLWLVVDFDGTCTVRDTTPILPRLASSCVGEDDEARRRRQDAFEVLEGRYFELYEEAKTRIFADGGGGGGGGGDPGTTALTLDDALESLDAASTEVTRGVSESGVLAGISDCPAALESVLFERSRPLDGNVDSSADGDRWSSAAYLRPGCVEALSSAVHRDGWHLGVLSINWCPPLIEAALLRRVRRAVDALKLSEEERVGADASGEDGNEEEDPSSRSSLLRRLSERNIWSNAVNAEGVVDLPVPGAVAKRERIARLKRIAERRSGNDDKEEDALSSPSLSSSSTSLGLDSPTSSTPSSSSSLVVYVGDSSTDLLGLLEADVGIFIGRPSGTTAAIAGRWGVPMLPLAKRGEMGVKGGDRNDGESDSSTLVEADRGTIWVTEHWAEIDAVLARLSRHT